ncbi:MAG TPA: mannose-1-phosphate guanylyltransferase [Planctomycetaceae bacterium]|nr:mannose-1-phosphate guanylyltransferase [Planctomycetaceae bacterium]
MLYLVIMAGGSGTRFWPESRRARPKQFLTLAGERSLLVQAADRCRTWIPTANMRVVTNAAHAAETSRQLPELAREHILLEPCGRNTAPCIGLAAWQIWRNDPDAVVLVTPADHLIRPESEFRATVERALGLIDRQPRASVLLGIEPSYPATGYGYIERGEPASAGEGGASRVRSFREKPTLETARRFLAGGNFVWNSGIFVWRAARILELLKEFQPAIYDGLERLERSAQSHGWEAALKDEFPRMPSISIDYGVLEPLAARNSPDDGVFVVPASFEWDDVGSWQALPGVLGTDDEGNTSSGMTCQIDTKGCVIRSTASHLVATIGLTDFVVVHTADATLIAPKGDESAIRKLVALLEERGYERFL